MLLERIMHVLCLTLQLPGPMAASPTLSNRWVNYGGHYGSASAIVEEGFCFVNGLVKNGGWGNIATLPSNCRPDKRLIFNLNHHQSTARVDVQTSGTISWHAGGKSHSWISLTGISFSIGSVAPPGHADCAKKAWVYSRHPTTGCLGTHCSHTYSGVAYCIPIDPWNSIAVTLTMSFMLSPHII